jgi:NitT/TauT family transport system substrate-binding protein
MSHKLRLVLITAGILLGLTLAHKKPWKTRHAAAAELQVGYLPVTCHLTCPVTDYSTKTTTTGTRFLSQRFTEFPTVVEALKARKIDATFLLAPLAMVLREQGVPIHIVYLGHRDGSTVIVPKNSTAKSLRDLEGKTFARPSKFSNQYLVITKLMEDEGMKPGDINFVDMPPPDMPSALAVGEGRARGNRPRSLLREGHLAALHFVRARRAGRADRRASRRRARSGARDRREW